MNAGEGIVVDPSPFDLRPTPERDQGAAALCLHGLTGTPWEVRPVAEALVARGIRALGPLVAGHEGGVPLLAATSRHAWVAKARRELETLADEHDRVYVVGVSLGGLIALRLAQTAQVDALVVIGVPLTLRAHVVRVLPLVRLFQSVRPKRSFDIRDPVAAARHPSLPAMPLDAVAELIALQGEVAAALHDVRAPILVAHGRLDRTAPPRNAERIHREVASSEKELFLLERSGHVATVDYDGPALARAAADFLDRR